MFLFSVSKAFMLVLQEILTKYAFVNYFPFSLLYYLHKSNKSWAGSKTLRHSILLFYTPVNGQWNVGSVVATSENHYKKRFSRKPDWCIDEQICKMPIQAHCLPLTTLQSLQLMYLPRTMMQKGYGMTFPTLCKCFNKGPRTGSF